MDVTGLRVSVDATPAKAGSEQVNTAMASMAQTARTVSAQLKASVDQMTGGITTGAGTVSAQMQRMSSAVSSGVSGMRSGLAGGVNAAATLEEAYAALDAEAVSLGRTLSALGSQAAVTGMEGVAGAVGATVGAIGVAERNLALTSTNASEAMRGQAGEASQLGIAQQSLGTRTEQLTAIELEAAQADERLAAAKANVTRAIIAQIDAQELAITGVAPSSERTLALTELATTSGTAAPSVAPTAGPIQQVIQSPIAEQVARAEASVVAPPQVDWTAYPLAEKGSLPLARGASWMSLNNKQDRIMEDARRDGTTMSQYIAPESLAELERIASDDAFKSLKKESVYFGLEGEKFANMKEGDTFSALGMRSTTTDVDRARAYQGEGGGLFHAELPEGTRAVRGSVLGAPETTLLPGAQFKVTGKENGVTHVSLESDGTEYVQKLASFGKKVDEAAAGVTVTAQAEAAVAVPPTESPTVLRQRALTDAHAIRQAAIDDYRSGIAPLAEHSEGGYRAVVMPSRNQADLDLPADGQNFPSKGQHLIFKEGKDNPIPTGKWMDWNERRLHPERTDWPSEEAYNAMPIGDRAMLEAKEQVRYAPSQYKDAVKYWKENAPPVSVTAQAEAAAVPTLYHGTTAANASAIEQEGLKTSLSESAQNRIYATTDQREALKHAVQKAGETGEDTVGLATIRNSDAFEKTPIDPVRGGSPTAYRTTSDVPPSAILGTERYTVSDIKQAMSGGAKDWEIPQPLPRNYAPSEMDRTSLGGMMKALGSTQDEAADAVAAAEKLAKTYGAPLDATHGGGDLYSKGSFSSASEQGLKLQNEILQRKLVEDTTLYRGVGGEHAREIQNMKPGDVMDYGDRFMSTSTSRPVAEQFAKMKSMGPEDRSVFQVNAKAGDAGAFMGYQGAEVALPAQTKLQMVSQNPPVFDIVRQTEAATAAETALTGMGTAGARAEEQIAAAAAATTAELKAQSTVSAAIAENTTAKHEPPVERVKAEAAKATAPVAASQAEAATLASVGTAGTTAGQQVAAGAQQGVQGLTALRTATAAVVTAQAEMRAATVADRSAQKSLAEATAQLSEAAKGSAQAQQILSEYEQGAVQSSERLALAKQNLTTATKAQTDAARAAASAPPPPPPGSPPGGGTVSGAMGDAESGQLDLIAAAQKQVASATLENLSAQSALREGYASLAGVIEPTNAELARQAELEGLAAGTAEQLTLAKKNLVEVIAYEEEVAAGAVVSMATLAQAENAAAGAGHSVTDGMRAASGAAQLLEGRLPIRAFERFTTMIPGLSTALNAIFPLVGAAAFLMMIGEVISKMLELRKEAEESSAAIQQSAMKMTNGFESALDAAHKTGDELDNAYAKMTGHHENALKIMLDDAKEAADRFGDALSSDLDKIDEMGKKNVVGSMGNILSVIGQQFGGTGVGANTAQAGALQYWDQQMRQVQVQDFGGLQAAKASGDVDKIKSEMQKQINDLKAVQANASATTAPELDARLKAQQDYAAIQAGKKTADQVVGGPDFATYAKYNINPTVDNTGGTQMLQTGMTSRQLVIDRLQTDLDNLSKKNRNTLATINRQNSKENPVTKALEELDTKALFSGQLAQAALVGPGAVADVQARQAADLEIAKLRPKGLTGTYDERTGAATGQAKQVVDDLAQIRQDDQLQKESNWYRENSREVQFNTETQRGLLDVIKQGPAAVEEYMRTRQEENAIEREGEGLTGDAAEAFEKHSESIRKASAALVQYGIDAQRAQAVQEQLRSLGQETAATQALITAQNQSGAAVRDAQVTSQVNNFALQNNVPVGSDQYNEVLKLSLAQAKLNDEQRAGAEIIANTDPIRGYADTMGVLNDALNDGIITWSQYAYAAQNAAEVEAQATEQMLMRTKTAVGGVKAALIEIQQDSADFAKAANQTVITLYSGLSENLGKMIATGEHDFTSVVKQASTEMSTQIVKHYVTGPIFGAVGNALNLGTSLQKADGSKESPYWVQVANMGGLASSLPGGSPMGTSMKDNPVGGAVTWLLGKLGVHGKTTGTSDMGGIFPGMPGTTDAMGNVMDLPMFNLSGRDSGTHHGLLAGTDADPFGFGSLMGGYGKPDGTQSSPYYVKSAFGGQPSSSTGTDVWKGIFDVFGAALGAFGGGGGDSGGGEAPASSVETFANGGITAGITRAPSMFMTSEFHHSEAVVPLPDGRSIPVSMRGGGGNNDSGGTPPPIQVKLVDGTTNKVGAKTQDAKWDEKLKGYMVQIYLKDAETAGPMTQLRANERSS